MISKMKLQNGILTLIGFIMLVSICVLVNRLESRKPEMEIRESIEGVNVYNLSLIHISEPTRPY